MSKISTLKAACLKLNGELEMLCVNGKLLIYSIFEKNV